VPERKVAVFPVSQAADAQSLNYYHSKRRRPVANQILEAFFLKLDLPLH